MIFYQKDENPFINGQWQPKDFSLEERIQKMQKNSLKAFQEFDTNNPGYSCLKPAFDNSIHVNQLNQLTYHFFEEQGYKNEMEDAHFIVETDQSLLAGILDGHGGDAISKLVSERFSFKFSKIMKENNGDVHASFEKTFHEIEMSIQADPDFFYEGSTAIICYIDKIRSQIFTATLGDSEATIFRKVDESYQVIPLSCVRNWLSSKDYKRVVEQAGKNNLKLLKNWQLKKEKNAKAKSYRYPLSNGLNVSRCFGDIYALNDSLDGPGLSHKPKITVNYLKSGDILVMGCDRLYDFVKAKEIAEQLDQKGFHKVFAENLVTYAIEYKNSKDNVSVIAMQIL